MLCFLKIFDAALFPPACKILDRTTFCKRNAIRMDVLNGLNLELLVMIACDLYIQGGSHSISPWLRTRV